MKPNDIPERCEKHGVVLKKGKTPGKYCTICVNQNTVNKNNKGKR